MEGNSRPDGRGEDRGQTTLDFAIGMSVFLVSVAFVLGFAPSMLEPFNEGPQEETVVGTRVADQLASGMLAEPGEPLVLDVDCAPAFFDDSFSDAGCRFEQDTALGDRVGVDRYNVNVTLERNVTGDAQTEVVCHDAGALVECTGSEPRMAAGRAPTEGTGSIVVARRIVSYDGTDTSLVVRVW